MAENKTIQLDVETNLGSLRTQLRNAQAEVAILSEKFGATSTEAANAAKKAAELKDRIADAKALTDAFNPDAKFNSLTTSIGGALNGFQAFEGALGIMGVESEDLQKQLLKVQSAMALSQGLQGLGEAKDSFIQLGSVVKDVVVKSFTTLRGAIMTTGIGALVVTVGYLVNKYIESSEAANKAAEEQKKLNEQINKQNESIAKESGHFVTLIEMLKQTNQGSKERKDLIEKINNQYGTTIKNLKDERDFQNQLNDEVKNYLRYQTAKYALQANEEAIQNNLKTQWNLQSRINKLQEEQDKLLKKGALTKKETYETDDLGRRISTGLGYANEQLAGAYQKVSSELSTLQNQLTSAKSRFDKYGEAALKSQQSIDKLTEGGKKYVEQNNEVEKSIVKVTETKEKALSQDEIEAIFTQQLIDEENKRLESKKALTDEKIADDERYQKYWWDLYWDTTKYQDELAEKEKEKEKQRLKDRIDLATKYAQTFGDVMGSLNGLLNAQDEERLKHVQKGSKEEEAIKRKMFERDKKLRIVQTIIDTASNVVQSVRNGGGIPTGIPFGIAAATMGALQIATIAKTSFSSGNEQPSNAPMPSAASTVPTFNISGGNQTSQLLQGLQTQPLKAYVVSSDITSAQLLDQKAIKTSVL